MHSFSFYPQDSEVGEKRSFVPATAQQLINTFYYVTLLCVHIVALHQGWLSRMVDATRVEVIAHPRRPNAELKPSPEELLRPLSLQHS
jgi:hypothetical protein